MAMFVHIVLLITLLFVYWPAAVVLLAFGFLVRFTMKEVRTAVRRPYGK
jgi:ABC-type transport system involved in cytochrome bd biosynthesis fused ATPase/permease subunit